MRKMYVLMLMMVLAMGTIACGGKEESASEPEVTVAPTEEVVLEETATVEPTQEPVIEATPEATIQVEADTNQEEEGPFVYYGDENAEYILKEKIEEQEVTPELLLEKLASKDVLTDDIKVNGLKTVEKEDGTKKLEVDFSSEFQTLMFSQGSAGEYIMMGSVVNTFLKAYEADCMVITVDGNILESGHSIYDAEMKYYEPDNSADAEEVANDIASALGIE